MPVVTGNVEILHRAQMGQDVYIYGIRTYQTYMYIHIYIYRQFSVFTTSVGLAVLAPIIAFFRTDIAEQTFMALSQYACKVTYSN